MIERKAYPISDLKFDETGTIEAIVSVFNNVDSGNEIVRPGFFKKSIERKLPKGVWAHDWRQPIAKTIEAREIMAGDPALPPHLKNLGGTYIKGQFNLDTQRGREAYSDIKFGIVDEFSIGYSVTKDGKDEKTGARELIEGDWKEWSPVLVGMNSETHLVSIKSGGLKNKGMLAEEMAQTTPSIWDLHSAFCRVVAKIAETAKDANITNVSINVPSKVSEVVAEYTAALGPIINNQISEYLDSSDDEFYLKALPVGTFTDNSQSVLAAVSELTQRAKEINEIRTKEGRTLSSLNRNRLSTLLASLKSVSTDIESLLVETEPKKDGLRDLRLQQLRLKALTLKAAQM